MGKPSNSNRERQALLRGIVDASEIPKVAILKESGGQMILDHDLESLHELVSNAEPGTFIHLRTFRWAGTRSTTQQVLWEYVRTDSIKEIHEVTEDTWQEMMSDQATRAQQQQAQQLGVPRLN